MDEVTKKCGGRGRFSQTRETRGGLVRTPAFLLFLSLLFGGCTSPKTHAGPSIEFTKIPPAAQGGRERVDTITGRVTGWHPGQQIVV